LMFPVFRFYIPAALLSFNSYTSWHGFPAWDAKK
jgi:hypothetical protein